MMGAESPDAPARLREGHAMDIGWKLASAGATAVAALVASKATETGWRFITGHDAPHGDDDDEVSVLQVVVFAAVSAAAVALARRYAVRGAKKWYGPRELGK